MPRESNLEIKVGLFVVAAIVCLAGFVFSISDFSFFRKGFGYRVVFNYAGGLKKGAPVRLAGVDAGYVRGISILDGAAAADTGAVRAVVVDVWMDAGQNIPQDSRFSISQLGLLGEKYLEVMPGVSLASLAPGGMAHGEDPVSMEVVMKMMSSIGARLDVTLEKVNNGVLTPQNTDALAATLANLADVTQGVKAGVLSETNKEALSAILVNMAAVSDGLNKGEGTIGRFLKDAVVFENLDELTADLKANPWKLLYRPKKPSRRDDGLGGGK